MIKNQAFIMNLRWVMLVGGIISILFGVLAHMNLPVEDHNLQMLTGMFTGCGTAFLAIGAYGFILNARMTPEEKRQVEIDRKDERNAMICGKAYTVSGNVTSVFFAVSSFVLVGLGNRGAAYLCIGGMYLQIISMALAQLYYQKRM